MVKSLIRITAPHFVAGLEIEGAIGCYDYDNELVKIHRCAPILKYMRSWSIPRITRYCKKRGWELERE